MTFLLIPDLGTTFKTYMIMQQCKERTSVEKKIVPWPSIFFIFFSLAISHTCKVIQDQNKAYKIRNVSLRHMLKMWYTLPDTCKIPHRWPTVSGNPVTWLVLFSSRICIQSHTKRLEDVKGFEENVDGCCIYIYNTFKARISKHWKGIKSSCLNWWCGWPYFFNNQAQRNQAPEQWLDTLSSVLEVFTGGTSVPKPFSSVH